MQISAANSKRPSALCVMRLLLSLVLVAVGGGNGGGFRLLVQHIEILGPRQWLGLVAVAFVPAAPALMPITHRIADRFARQPVPETAEQSAEPA